MALYKSYKIIPPPTASSHERILESQSRITLGRAGIVTGYAMHFERREERGSAIPNTMLSHQCFARGKVSNTKAIFSQKRQKEKQRNVMCMV